MNIFYGFHEMGKKKGSRKNYFEYPDLSLEEQRQFKQNNKGIIQKPKVSFWSNLFETGRCLLQVVITGILFIALVLIYGQCTKGCKLEINTEPPGRYGRFHQ